MTRDQLRDVLHVALRAGQIMLEGGSNTSRAEETIHLMGTGLGADWMEVYVTPSGIIATAVSHGETRTRIQRIVRSTVQLSRLEQVLHIVEAAQGGRLQCQEAWDALEALAQKPRCYSAAFTALAVGLACSAFLVLFGGTPKEAALVLVIAGLSQWFRHFLQIPNLGRFLSTTIVAAFASFAALQCSRALGVSELTVAASLLLLVPGVPLVSGTADLFRGDILAGISRAVTAFLTVLAGSVGVWAVILTSGQTIELQVSTQESAALTALMGLISAGGFAVLLDVPPKHLAWAGLAGGLATVTRWLALKLGLPLVAASFWAGLSLGVAASAIAYWRKTTTSLYSMPGYIPLVPGVVALRAILHLVKEEYAVGLADLVRVSLILAAVAIGIGVIRTLVHLRTKPVL